MDILIVYGYHPKETFAINVGECLLQNNSNPRIKIVKYVGKRDSKTSTYHLRKFIKNFNPSISPIILHDDDKNLAGLDGVIIFNAKSKDETRKARRYLLNFISEKDRSLSFGRFVIISTDYNLFDVELNSQVGIKKSTNLIRGLSEYLMALSDKGIKL